MTPWVKALISPITVLEKSWVLRTIEAAKSAPGTTGRLELAPEVPGIEIWGVWRKTAGVGC